ncbi:hypothetical protein DESUT3_03700 [Desulfuromonas versatilis]|uniref:Uncharacterized protein n=1 Tax=Desulfuromonas versatilis TaxID=2802975 RepID=A0ABN6DT12_9BACT|nr:hypothetical protein [Desulfuromonas versatilis]BCR03301.1 hypothetical protein DESUT3_03700 [Desulfuromonas versatilis]
MTDSKDSKLRGVASLYSSEELKKFIGNYLLMMGIVEGFIFFVCWVSHLAGQDAPFPWKFYLIASFIAPVAITFIFGIIVVGFNKYMFDRKLSEEAPTRELSAEEVKPKWVRRFEMVLHSLRQVPFLLALLLLVVSAGIIYNLDIITAYIANAGEKAAQYLFISLAVVLGVAFVTALVWMSLSYNLRKRRQDYLFQYRRDVMERLGLVILEDETVIDRDGRVVSEGKPRELGHDKGAGKVTLLPNLPED